MYFLLIYNCISMNSKEIYNIKKIEHLNNIDNKYNNENLQKLIIQSEKIVKPNIDINKSVKKKESENKIDFKKCEKNRVNNPYKCIIKNFNYDKKIDDDKDLIVYTVNKKDKDKNTFNKNLKKHNVNKKKIDKDIEETYGLDNKNKHKKKFDYNHTYKYRSKIEEDSNDNDLRVDRVEHYKKQQQEMEDNKKKIDNILLGLIKTGAISDNLDSINYDKIDTNDFEETLKSAFGEVEFNKLCLELKK